MKALMLFLNYLGFGSDVPLKTGEGYRIIGGVPTSIEKHPWQVSIQIFGNHVCGGSIVSPDTILTAAHCVTELIVSAYYVVPGVDDLREAKNKFQVKEAIIHKSFDSETYDYDIAVLKLWENLTFSDQIQNINLPDESHVVTNETSLTVSGWGVTEVGSQISDILREVDVKYIDWDTCYSRLSDGDSFTKNMICAGAPEGGKDACEADSGGALELKRTLIGIVSWGHGCGEPDYPGVYTHVSYLRSWIREHTGI